MSASTSREIRLWKLCLTQKTTSKCMRATGCMPSMSSLSPCVYFCRSCFLQSGCREYVTGFRKRKQQRRKDALKKLENRQRQQRLEERAEVGHAVLCSRPACRLSVVGSPRDNLKCCSTQHLRG